MVRHKVTQTFETPRLIVAAAVATDTNPARRASTGGGTCMRRMLGHMLGAHAGLLQAFFWNFWGLQVLKRVIKVDIV
jgi:hypothetical protein